MQHTLVAVFDNRNDAQNAKNELLSSNFSQGDVHLSNADPTGMTDSVTGRSDHDAGEGFGATIKNFFTDLFGADDAVHASKYEGAVTRGHHVLTVRASSLSEVERAADIVERYGPTDIDEQATGTDSMSAGAMGLGASPESRRMGNAGAMQQATSGANMQLDNPGDRNLFQQQSLHQAEPMGGTYQEPMGKSGLTATGGTTLHDSTLRDSSKQDSPLDVQRESDTAPQGASSGASASQGRADTGSLQRDTSLGGATSGAQTGSGSNAPRMSSIEIQRGRTRIYSPSASGSGLDVGSQPGDDDDDDEYYRNHFLSYYSGEDYDSFLPAYTYGTDEARSGKYAGRKWDEVENDLRTDWESRNAGSTESTWDRMKAAVRRGWDRITSDDDDDEAYYRSHYDSNLSSSGEDYDSYKPAYSYGAEMRKSQMYRNQPWDDIEGDMRRGWDSRIAPASERSGGGTEEGAWDRMKAAVRHGWERMTDDDDDIEYRAHWTSTYGVEGGGTYDQYRPAYTYGSEMARNDRYRGRDWNDVENDLHADWDRRYGSDERSTWDKMKAAVRHGWDRMTS